MRHAIFECPHFEDMREETTRKLGRRRTPEGTAEIMCGNAGINSIQNVVVKANIIARCIELRRTWLETVEKIMQR